MDRYVMKIREIKLSPSKTKSYPKAYLSSNDIRLTGNLSFAGPRTESISFR
jgi:hypothetical protein